MGFSINVDGSLLMAAIALVVSILSLYFQRKHDVLSVRPIGEILRGDYINRLVVTVQNNGTGPLVVKKFRAFDESGREEKSVIAFFDNEKFASVVWTMFIPTIDGLAILPGERKVMLEIIGEVEDLAWIKRRAKIRNVLKELEIVLEYEDIYKNRMPVKRERLDFFAR